MLENIFNPIEEANLLLKKFNVNEPPIDVDFIAKEIGIDLFYEYLPDDISGILNIEQNKKPIIIINSEHHKNRKRFSIAHEIGHYILHKNNGIHIDKKSFLRDNKSSQALYSIEIEANKFAAELLMPIELLKKEIENIEDIIDFEEDIISELAKKFEVSTTAMGIKFQSLGYFF